VEGPANSLFLPGNAGPVHRPECDTPSDHLHSRYRRTGTDLPCPERSVILRLIVRRFRCVNPACPRVIFCERIPALLRAHARTTARLTEAHCALGFALRGEPGSRLAQQLNMPTSADTLLRRVKACPDEPSPSPRYIGVDDWALRKGQRYGTILIDLERRRVIDILEGRDGTALAAWLKEHPGVEVITRDRWAAFAQASREGAPQARQVADRWHLLKNLREVVEHLLGIHSVQVREVLAEVTVAATPGQQPSDLELSPRTAEAPLTLGILTPKQQAQQERQQERVRSAARNCQMLTRRQKVGLPVAGSALL
jgi:hypothetical protein